MSTELIISLISSVGALIVSAFALLQKTAETRRNTQVMEAAQVLTGYSTLVDDLQRQIEVNNTDIARLRQELEALRCQSQRDREEWEKERADLQMQIGELQEENKRLRKLLGNLKKGGADCDG